MKKFTGFTDHETFSRVPDSFFRHLLPGIDTADELKVTLYAIWRFEHMESRVRFLREKDFAGLVPDPLAALEKAVQRGSLLKVLPSPAGKNNPGGKEVLYFLNSPRGRAAAGAYGQGTWSPDEPASFPPPERPNIFKIYEENIGPLTPLLADALKDAELNYPPEWIVEALAEAVLNNKRSWKYVEAILRRWKDEGHAKEQDRRDVEGLRGRDVTRKVEDFLKR
jgi:DnaD/phage-associated family protein